MPKPEHPTIADPRQLTLPQLLRWHAEKTPEATALRRKKLGIWEAISWREYYEAALHFALGLRSLGVTRGERIIIASENSPEWFFADLGAEILGVEVVGIYPTNPAAELRYIARHSKARLAVCGDQEQADKILEATGSEGGIPDLRHLVSVDMRGMRKYSRTDVASFDELLETGRRMVSASAEARQWVERELSIGQANDVNMLIYTSGTTGPPKGAMLTHSNLTHAVCAFAEAAGLKPGQYESVCYLPLCHVAERSYSMVMHLVQGGCVNFAESIDTVSADIREIAPSFFLGVPRIWEKLQQHFMAKTSEAGNRWGWLFRRALQRGGVLAERRAAQGRATALQAFEFSLWSWLLFRNVQRHMGLDRTTVRVCGGASVSPETLRFFDAIGLPIYQGYGLTESCGMAFVQRPNLGNRAGSCGLPLEGVQWRLEPDGELLLKSPSVFRGYLFDEAGSADVMTADGWLRTGDIVEVGSDGEISVIDRKKAIIITSGGKNISPSEIENAMKDSPYIRETIVVGEGRKFLGALIQIDGETVGRWASERNIAYNTYKSLARHPEVVALVQTVVDAVNARFARAENIRRFAVLEKELDHEDGELTATQKIRRSIVEARFARELQTIYSEERRDAVRA